MAFSADGATLAVALESQRIKLWDVASGRMARTFEEKADDVTFSIAFSPDGTRFVTSMERDQDEKPGNITVVLNWFEELKRLVPTN